MLLSVVMELGADPHHLAFQSIGSQHKPVAKPVFHGWQKCPQKSRGTKSENFFPYFIFSQSIG